MKRSSDWRDSFEYEGHELNVSSDNEYVYLTIKGANDKLDNCNSMTYKQLEDLMHMLHDAVGTLKTEKRWDTKGKKKSNG